jgi:peptidoglycan-N-acetylglucosamine deacetylase
MTHRVCLTFDFDTSAGMIARGLTTPTPVSRGEFGAVAVPRLLKLLAARQIATTWFIPGYTAATYPDAVADVAAAGHELGNHGWTHVPPARLSPEEEERELVETSDLLERLTGARPRGYRSPSWDLSPVTIELLERHGFDYDSSMMGHDLSPYRARRGDEVVLGKSLGRGPETGIAELPVSWSLDDFLYLEYLKDATGVMLGGFDPDRLFANALGDFDWMRRELREGVLTITFHPYVIGRGHRLLALEAFLDELTARGARFVTCGEAVADWRADPAGWR